MQMQWKILRPERSLVQQIQNRLNCHPITATVLANRNIGSTGRLDRFFHPGLDSLPSPDALTGMQTAIERIIQALDKQENILIFGDYDADGVTATAVLANFLKAAGARVICHLPHRVKEGYGLQPVHIMQLAVPRHINLIITVDNGCLLYTSDAADE